MAEDMVVEAIQELRAHMRFPVRKVQGQWWGGTIGSTTHQLLYVFPLIGHYVEIPPIDDYRRGGRAFDIMNIGGRSQIFDLQKRELVEMSSLGIHYADPALWVYRAPEGAKWTKALINPWPTSGKSGTLSYDAALSNA